jgi:hypothetical protein
MIPSIKSNKELNKSKHCSVLPTELSEEPSVLTITVMSDETLVNRNDKHFQNMKGINVKIKGQNHAALIFRYQIKYPWKIYAS